MFLSTQTTRKRNKIVKIDTLHRHQKIDENIYFFNVTVPHFTIQPQSIPFFAFIPTLFFLRFYVFRFLGPTERKKKRELNDNKTKISIYE